MQIKYSVCTRSTTDVNGANLGFIINESQQLFCLSVPADPQRIFKSLSI